MVPIKTNHMWACIDGQEIEGKAGTLDVAGADYVEILLSANRRNLWINKREHCLLRVWDMRGIVLLDDMRDHSGRQMRAWVEREKRGAAKREIEMRRFRDRFPPIAPAQPDEFALKVNALLAELAAKETPTATNPPCRLATLMLASSNKLPSTIPNSAAGSG